jgi:hypothetical protein
MLPDSASPHSRPREYLKGATQTDGIMDAGYQNTISRLLRKRGEMLASMPISANRSRSYERPGEHRTRCGNARLRRRTADQRAAEFHAWCCSIAAFYTVLDRTRAFYISGTGALSRAKVKDGRDRRIVNDIVKRMGKALGQMRDTGIIAWSAEKLKGEYVG